MAKTKRRRGVRAVRSGYSPGKKVKRAAPAPGALDLSEWTKWLREAARAAILETPAPTPRKPDEPPTWEEGAFHLLGGRRPSDVLTKSPIALLHPALSITLLSLSEDAIGPPGLGYGPERVMYEAGIGISAGRLRISRPRTVVRRPFIWSWSRSSLAIAELRRCFEALATRRTRDGKRITSREWQLVKENELLEKAGYSEKQRAELISSLDGRTPATESVAVSRARLKLGQRRRREHERRRRN